MARPSVLPSTMGNASASRMNVVFETQWLAYALPCRRFTPPPSRTTAHGSGPMWIATPSSQWTCTTYSLPVSRRTPILRDLKIMRSSLKQRVARMSETKSGASFAAHPGCR